jgi:hypothetical protein
MMLQASEWKTLIAGFAPPLSHRAARVSGGRLAIWKYRA